MEPIESRVSRTGGGLAGLWTRGRPMGGWLLRRGYSHAVNDLVPAACACPAPDEAAEVTGKNLNVTSGMGISWWR